MSTARRLTSFAASVLLLLAIAAGCGDDDTPPTRTTETPTRATDAGSSGDAVAGDVEGDRAVDAAARYDAQAAPIVAALVPVARRAGAVAGTSGRATPLAAIVRQEAAARALADRARAIDTTDPVLLDASMQLATGIDALGDTFDLLATLAATDPAERDAELARAGAAFDDFSAQLAAWNDALDSDGRDFPRSVAANDRLGDVLAGLELG